MKRFSVFVFLLLFSVSFSQKTETFRLKKFYVSQLSDTVQETSGLDFFNEKLFTFNDSGNQPEIFQIDSASGKILKIYRLPFQNTDWEAIANDGKYLYIGDFGNNAGTRKDLKIFKIPFEEGVLKTDSVSTIRFHYPEQKEFVPKNINNDFDAEAMIFLNGKIHVFTKEWASKGVSHYVLDPDLKEDQPAEKTESFKTHFVVTDAAYFDGKLYLVGYTKMLKVYLEIFEESEPGSFFQKPSRKYLLGNALSLGQMEGIAVDQNGIYFSAEKFNSPIGNQKQSFYFVPNEKFRAEP